MSSHHIVRDEQEPALAILEKDFDINTIQNLLEWSPTVITIPKLIESIIPYGFKIDVVICCKVEIEPLKEQLHHQLPIKFVNNKSSYTDLLQVIHFLIDGNYNALNVIGKISIEMIESIRPFIDKMNIVLYYQGFKWYYVKSDSFKKWVPVNSIFKTFDSTLIITQVNNVLPFVKSEEEFQINIKEEGFVNIESKNEGFWLGENI
jgi:thiamine pyrophosphokinase